VENFVFWPWESRYEQVEMIFGESKSAAALNPAERTKLRAFAGKAGSYLCFCTLAEDFSEDDETFFRELVEAKIGVIMLNRFFLKTEYFELLTFQNAHRTGRSKHTAAWIMRVTTIRTLGNEFATKHTIGL
jgi:hypothetical protein